jgi:[ribosomal protein S5]-alanine N-acetyltransferase
MDGAPASLTTDRLRLRKPTTDDAPAILRRYASDVEVTRLLGWPRHESIEHTEAFLASSEDEWSRRGVGPYLILDNAGTLVGTTGLHVEKPHRAATGYVLARDAWGRGYATEAVGAMVELAASLRIRRLYALCHPDNRGSSRVLQKAAFALEGVLRRHTVFPNLDPAEPQDVECWARIS